MIIGSQNSQWQLSTWTMGPASTRPKPPPTASSAAEAPTAPATLSRGNSSRMMPTVRGSTPPPTPWIARAAISTPMDGATAASNEPTASAPRASTSIRSSPTLSPIRPTIGVNTDAETR